MQDKSGRKSEGTSAIDHEHSIRHKLYEAELSTWKRYALLVNGDTSVGKLLKYEAIVFLFGSLPGALGLALRQYFYKKLFRKVGRGVVFGRDLVIRNAGNIVIGDQVVIDDQTVIDARGAGDEGIIIGDETVLNRDVVIISKVGGIHIGARTDIGSRASLISTGGIRIGDGVAIAGDCKIGGSAFSFGKGTEGERTSTKYTKGPVQIDDQCTLFMSAMVMDGVHMGRGAVAGPGVILRDNVKENTVVVAHQKQIHLPIDSTQIAGNDDAEASAAGVVSAAESRTNVAFSVAQPGDGKADDHKLIVDAVYAAIDELNLLRPPQEHLVKALETELSELDSMDFVNLIVETEIQVEEILGVAVNLRKEATSSGRDAFENLGTFVHEIQVILGR